MPTLPQVESASAGSDENEEGEEGTQTRQVIRPSKAMILAGAIEYIKMLEKERDELRARAGES